MLQVTPYVGLKCTAVIINLTRDFVNLQGMHGMPVRMQLDVYSRRFHGRSNFVTGHQLQKTV